MTVPPNGDSLDARLAGAGLPPLPRTAWLELDLDALAGNLAALRARAGLGVPVHPVVKADAYGHGAVPIAMALEAAGADGLSVATIDEAVELRDGGVGLPIHVLYPVPAAWLDAALDGQVDLSAGDPVLLDRLLAAHAARPAGELRVQLEVETGLGRGGFAVDAVGAVAARLATTTRARLTGLWTHLQAVEDAPRTADQMARFETAIGEVTRAGVELPRRHAASSAGILADGVAAYEGIRPGLALYGLVPDELADMDLPADPGTLLRPVLALRARPVRVADLPAGSGISYGPTFTTSRPSRIATLPLGYGDGWARSLSNRADALVRGIRCPIVGNVAMDALMVDVTDVPGPRVTLDDEFVLLGEQDGERIAAFELARSGTTISWEVLARMARRVPRVYYAGAVPTGLRTLTEGRGQWQRV